MFKMKRGEKMNIMPTITSFHQTRLWMAVLTLPFLWMGACGEPAVDINRVQPNYTPKEMFGGDWHFRATVVDKQHSSSYPFVGYEGGLDRVRWEITETRLLAFR